MHSPCDAALDARVIAASADLGAEKVHRLPVSVQAFSLGTYLALARSFMERARAQGQRPLRALGTLAAPHWRGTTAPDFMRGPLQLQPRARPVRVPRAPAEGGARATCSAPLRLDPGAVLDLPAETSQFVVMVHGVLAQLGPVPLYRFITDPRSFAQSVENLFYVSFLINDNLARLSLAGVPSSTTDAPSLMHRLLLEALDPSRDALSDASRQPQQMVLGLTMRLWQACIDHYCITAPMIRYS